MVKYKAEPRYTVRSDDIRIAFNHVGEYETNNAAEIEVLDGLVPRYVRKVDDGKPAEKPKSEPKPEPKPESTLKNKSGGKSGGKAKTSGK